jgi:acyl carrier protein
MSRLDRAIETIRECIATISDVPVASIGNDDDLIDDMALDPLELESLALVLEEIFSITVPECVWKAPVFRTAASLAEWCIRQSDLAAWAVCRNGARPQRLAGRA